MSYIVTTPMGAIRVDTEREAQEYKKLYGYPYRRETFDEMMNNPATIEDIIRRANEINKRLRDVENMPEVDDDAD